MHRRRRGHGRGPGVAAADGETLSKRLYDRVRRICLALPEACEKIAWGEPTFRVRDRMFLMFANNHHGDGRIAVWCRAAPGAQEDLVRADPGQFFVPPYVGTAGWIGIHLNKGLAPGVLAGLVKDGYLEVAPRALAKIVSGKTGKPASR